STVTTTYYRVARASGAVRPRQRATKATPVKGTRGRRNAAQSVRRPHSVQSGTDREGVDEIIGQLVASVQALTEAVKAQNAEVRELRGRLDLVRQILT